MTTTNEASAWERFITMSEEVHDMLIGAAQCRNHLRALDDCWTTMSDEEKREAMRLALDRLTRVGI